MKSAEASKVGEEDIFVDAEEHIIDDGGGDGVGVGEDENENDYDSE